MQSLLHQPNLLWRYRRSKLRASGFRLLKSMHLFWGASFGEEAGFLLERPSFSGCWREVTVAGRASGQRMFAGSLPKGMLTPPSDPEGSGYSNSYLVRQKADHPVS